MSCNRALVAARVFLVWLWITIAALCVLGHAQEPATAYITFCVNTHDFIHPEESADTLLRLIELFESHGVRGDFYLTSPIVYAYADQRPDVLERLITSGMTISYHVRPPHPAYRGFGNRLEGMDAEAATELLTAYETTRLDLSTGGLIGDEPGGMSHLTEVFGEPPVAASIPYETWRPVLLPIWADMGAHVTVTYHEQGTSLHRPFVWRDGLLIRPSDFSITRWAAPGREAESFWWTMLDTPWASDFVPVDRLREELASWTAARPPFVTVLIHENNFYRQGATPWADIYYETKRKVTPRTPPFDLSTPDPSSPRTSANESDIWAAYRELVAYAASRLSVVTSEDIVTMAEQISAADAP